MAKEERRLIKKEREQKQNGPSIGGGRRSPCQHMIVCGMGWAGRQAAIRHYFVLCPSGGPGVVYRVFIFCCF